MGELVPLLRDCWPAPLNAYAIYPQTRYLSRRARAFIDFLAERFGDRFVQAVDLYRRGDRDGFRRRFLAVRDWLGIEEKIDRPTDEHPKRPIEGFACTRSEVSGARVSTPGMPKGIFVKSPSHIAFCSVVKVQVSVMYLVLGSVATTTAVMSLGISRQLFTEGRSWRSLFQGWAKTSGLSPDSASIRQVVSRSSTK